MEQTKLWQKAQEEELSCWASLERKLNSEQYYAEKCRYWKELIKRMGITPSQLLQTRTLEVGCGPAGIFMIFGKDAHIGNYYLLDPLLESYRGIAARYLEGFNSFSISIEEACEQELGRFDQILAINCIDHCEDIHRFLERLRRLCASKARVFIAVNTHRRAWTARLWRAWQIEPLHPYHFTKEEYAELFASHFVIESIVSIEDLVVEVNNRTKTSEEMPSFLRRMYEGAKPAALLFNFFALCGLPTHDFKGVGNSIYCHELYLLRPNSA